MNDWIKQVDILAKGNEAGPVFDRIANGVFFAMVLRLIPPVNQKATTSSPPPPRHSAIDQGLILHARNRRSRHYNWTRVVFPMFHSKNIDLAPTLKRQLVEAEPEALQKLLYKVQQRIPLTDMPTQVQSKPHPQPQPQQRVQKTQHKNNLHMSPTFHQEQSQHLEHEPPHQERSQHLEHEPPHEPYLSDSAIDELDRRVEKLLRGSRKDREQELDTAFKHTMANENANEKAHKEALPNAMPTSKHPPSNSSHSKRKRPLRKNKNRQRLHSSTSSLPPLMASPAVATAPMAEPTSNASTTTLLPPHKIPSKQQLIALISDCSLAHGNEKRLVAATSVGFQLLEKLIRLKPPSKTNRHPQQCTSRDAAKLFTALIATLVNSDNNLVRSHVALNMITALQNISNALPEDLALLGINRLAHAMARVLSNRSLSNNVWSTTQQDLRIVSVLSEHYVLTTTATLLLCDPLSELWLTNSPWSQAACTVLTRLVLRHVKTSHDMCDYVLRLANVALGVYHKLEVDLVVATYNKTCVQDSIEFDFSASSHKCEPQQRQIIHFLLTVVVPNENTCSVDLMQGIGALIMETLRSLRALHRKYLALRETNVRATVGVKQDVLTQISETKPPAIYWLENLAYELNAVDEGANTYEKEEHQEHTYTESMLLTPLNLEKLSQTSQTPNQRQQSFIATTASYNDGMCTPTSSPLLTSVMALPISPTEIVNNPANHNQPTILVDPTVQNTSTTAVLSQTVVPIVSPTATIVDAVPRTLTPQRKRSPFVSPNNNTSASSAKMLDTTLTLLKDTAKRVEPTFREMTNPGNLAEQEHDEEEHDEEEDEIQDALVFAAAVSKVNASPPTTLIHHHVYHVNETPPQDQDTEKTTAVSDSPPDSPPPEQQTESDTNRVQNLTPRTRICQYLKRTCYPSAFDLLNAVGLEQFCKHTIGEDQGMSMEECVRFVRFITQGQGGGISLEGMVRFIQQGLQVSMDDRKRASYLNKSSMHVKLMQLVLEIWRQAVLTG